MDNDTIGGQSGSFFGNSQVKQQNIQADAVKQRHIDGIIIFDGLAADLPDGTTDVQAYFATDTNVLYIWNGTTWAEFDEPTPVVVSDGWNATSVSLTYASADAPTFVLTTGSDLRSLISVGMKMKFANNSTTFYGFVTAISASTITLYGGTDYVVANSAITLPYYSSAKAPFGFNTDPIKWTEQTKNVLDVSKSGPSASTWYNLGTISLNVPIGAWNVSYQVNVDATYNSSNVVEIQTTLSTANNSNSDVDLFAYTYAHGASGNMEIINLVNRSKYLTVAAKTPYYLNASTAQTGQNNLLFIGSTGGATIVRAVCAYL